MNRRHLSLIVLAVFVIAAVPASAGHAWGTYHWKKTSAEIAPPVHNNLTNQWDSYFSVAMSDWNASTVINSPYGSSFGPISNVKRCSSETGKIEVCNAKYGQTGWLGIAGISLSGGHIVKGYTKLNDTYFDTAKYNTPAWRAFVTCQEIGHDYGLGHVNEDFNNANTGSCMDYTSDPGGTPSNEHPNQHDYDTLKLIYDHTESSLVFDGITTDATRPATIGEILAGAGQWGTPISFDANGRPNVFRLQVGTNHKGELMEELVHVLWAPVDPFEDLDKPGRSRNHND